VIFHVLLNFKVARLNNIKDEMEAYKRYSILVEK
jgi:hypothetical protein